MKKLVVHFVFVCLLLFTVMFMSGCSSIMATVQQLQDGRVVQEILLTLDEDTQANVLLLQEVRTFIETRHLSATNNVERTIRNRYNEEVTFIYGKESSIELNERQLLLAITFDNFYSYAWFNDIDLPNVPAAQVDIERSLFFIERTVTMRNPFRTFFENAESEGGTRQIIEHFTERTGGDVADINITYVHHSSFRRTETNADRTTRTFYGWDHYFYITNVNDINDMIFFDRFANTAAWYGAGVLATAIFMLLVYYGLRAKAFGVTRGDLQGTPLR